MNDYQSFLRHLLDNPEDRVARLVFADWLEENNQSVRAEFIRVSIEKRESSDPRQRDHLTQKRLALLAENREAILAGLYPDFRYRFRYGLPWSVALSAEDALNHGETIFNAFPIPRLMLRNLLHFSFALSQKTWLKHLHEIRFTRQDRYRGRALSWLIASPHLTGLQTLHLRGVEEIGSVCEALRGQHRMHRLRKIDLANSGVHGWALKNLCECPSLIRVEELDLSNNPLTDASALTLTRCRNFKQLRVLNLSQHDHLSRAMRKRLRRHFGDRVLL